MKYVSKLADRRQQQIHKLKVSNFLLKDERRNDQYTIATLKNAIKTVPQVTIQDYKKVRSGKANEWPLWILQLVLEMLVNRTPPSVITKNIAS